LREDVNATKAGVEAIGNWDVYKPIFPGERHGGLGAFLGQREQPRAGATPHDDGESLLGNRWQIVLRHKGKRRTLEHRIPKWKARSKFFAGNI
jgi:hypothetical protein